MTIKSAQIASHAGSFRHAPRATVSLRLGHARALTPHRGVIHYPRAASLPLGGRLLCAVLLRIVGSGFCPIMRGLPRAMLAPDVSVGKTENITRIDNFSLNMRY